MPGSVFRPKPSTPMHVTRGLRAAICCAAFLLATATLASCTAEPTRPSRVAPYDYASVTEYATRLIRYEMDKNSVAGLSIALVDDQRVLWAAGFGYADRERQVPATADTIYRVGSVSKLFTDAAAMRLAEQGKLDIDRPLRNFLPGFSIRTRYPGSGEITPRLLMTHHSGLPRDRLKGFLNPHPAPFSGLVNEIREDYTAYPPNLVYYYSNLGVTLLGAAIEHQAGMPFADYMKQSLLDPMGMTHSSFDYGLAASPQAARGYRGLVPETDPPFRVVPAGGLNSSVSDLARFMSMVFADGMSGNRRILKAETVAEMLRPQNTDVPLDFNFRMGLGWMLSTFGTAGIANAGTVAHHQGGTLLFRSHLYILPEHKLGVVVVSNSSTAGLAVDHIAAETLALALEAKTGIRQPEISKVQPDEKPLPDDAAREFPGDYTTLAGFSTIYPCSQQLCAHTGGRNLDLVHGSDGLFRLDYALLGLVHIDLGPLGEYGLFRRTVQGREVLAASQGAEQMLVGQRISPPANIDLWRRYLGEYKIDNLGDDIRLVSDIRLVEEHGYLLLELTTEQPPKATSRSPLMPVSDTEAIVLGPLSGGGATARVVRVNGEERILLSGYLLRKIAP